jgi:hypothetical protein
MKRENHHSIDDIDLFLSNFPSGEKRKAPSSLGNGYDFFEGPAEIQEEKKVHPSTQPLSSDAEVTNTMDELRIMKKHPYYTMLGFIAGAMSKGIDSVFETEDIALLLHRHESNEQSVRSRKTAYELKYTQIAEAESYLDKLKKERDDSKASEQVDASVTDLVTILGGTEETPSSYGYIQLQLLQNDYITVLNGINTPEETLMACLARFDRQRKPLTGGFIPDPTKTSKTVLADLASLALYMRDSADSVRRSDDEVPLISFDTSLRKKALSIGVGGNFMEREVEEDYSLRSRGLMSNEFVNMLVASNPLKVEAILQAFVNEYWKEGATQVLSLLLQDDMLTREGVGKMLAPPDLTIFWEDKRTRSEYLRRHAVWLYCNQTSYLELYTLFFKVPSPLIADALRENNSIVTELVDYMHVYLAEKLQNLAKDMRNSTRLDTKQLVDLLQPHVKAIDEPVVSTTSTTTGTETTTTPVTKRSEDALVQCVQVNQIYTESRIHRVLITSDALREYYDESLLPALTPYRARHVKFEHLIDVCEVFVLEGTMAHDTHLLLDKRVHTVEVQLRTLHADVEEMVEADSRAERGHSRRQELHDALTTLDHGIPRVRPMIADKMQLALEYIHTYCEGLRSLTMDDLTKQQAIDVGLTPDYARLVAALEATNRGVYQDNYKPQHSYGQVALFNVNSMNRLKQYRLLASGTIVKQKRTPPPLFSGTYTLQPLFARTGWALDWDQQPGPGYYA